MKTTRIGIDFDGVLSENKLRIFRRPVVTLKKIIGANTKEKKFFVPKDKVGRYLWRLLHKFSVKPSISAVEMQRFSKENNVEFYLVTGRYGFLKDDLDNWIDKYGFRSVFKKIDINNDNNQPHVFKSQKIKELGLDYFIEDNWDIVESLDATNAKCKVYWIYNIFDYYQKYRFKAWSLKEALEKIIG